MTSPRPFQCGRSKAMDVDARERARERGDAPPRSSGSRSRRGACARRARRCRRPRRDRLDELGGDRHVGGGERRRDRRRLASASLLPRPQEHGALARRRAPGRRHRSRPGLPGSCCETTTSAPAASSSPQSELVLGSGGGVVGSGAPAVLAPVLGVLGERRPNEHALEACRSSTRAERGIARRYTAFGGVRPSRSTARNADTTSIPIARRASHASRSRCAA